MNNSQGKGFQIPGILILIAFIVFPPVGIVLGIMKFALQPKNTQRQQPVQHFNKDVVETNEDNYNSQYKQRNRSQIETFEHTITVRCPHCQSSNFTDHLPSKCEYCGEVITNKN
jgi:hypothetical protein